MLLFLPHELSMCNVSQSCTHDFGWETTVKYLCYTFLLAVSVARTIFWLFIFIFGVHFVLFFNMQCLNWRASAAANCG